MSTFFLIAAATTPGIAIAVYIYLHDKDEPEPVKLVVLSFFYGILSLGLDLAAAIPLEKFADIDEDDLKQQALHAFVIVAFVEELCKFIFVRGILYRNKNFNEPLDGIVYSVMVGMGFATAENLIYVLNGGEGIAIIRMFSAIPGHAMFAILSGFWLGKAKFTHRRENFYGIVALLVGTLFHGIYNFFLSISFVPGIWVWSALSLLVALFLSIKAIQLHQRISPFKVPQNREPDSKSS